MSDQLAEKLTLPDDDEDSLFAPLPPREDCPVCLVPLPLDADDTMLSVCCGKRFCGSCVWERRRVDLEEIFKTKGPTMGSRDELTKEFSKTEICAFCREHGTGNDAEIPQKAPCDLKCEQYSRLAAKGGNLDARHNLGIREHVRGNDDLAAKHWLMAAAAGDDGSLDEIKEEFLCGRVSKEKYAETLRAHQYSVDAQKNDEREKHEHTTVET